ncbi:MAG: sterol desaturase family protein [Planctomycetaceae bacterium]
MKLDKHERTTARPAMDRLLLLIAGFVAAVVAGYLWTTRRPLLLDNGRMVLLALLPVPLIVAATKIWPAKSDQRALSTGLCQDVAYFFAMGAFDALVMAWFATLLYSLYAGYLNFLTIDAIARWPLATRLMLSVVVADFLNWLHHLVRHKVPSFWCFHAVHHSQREMNVFTDLRYHFLEYVIAKLIIFVPAYMLQLVPLTAYGIAIAIRWHTMTYHANLRSNYGLLRYVLVTPQSHRIHHSALPEHRDQNFGVVFSIWDRIFGTQHPDYESYPETGIDDARFPLEQWRSRGALVTNLIRHTLYPFGQFLTANEKDYEQQPTRQSHPARVPEKLLG